MILGEIAFPILSLRFPLFRKSLRLWLPPRINQISVWQTSTKAWKLAQVSSAASQFQMRKLWPSITNTPTENSRYLRQPWQINKFRWNFQNSKIGARAVKLKTINPPKEKSASKNTKNLSNTNNLNSNICSTMFKVRFQICHQRHKIQNIGAESQKSSLNSKSKSFLKPMLEFSHLASTSNNCKTTANPKTRLPKPLKIQIRRKRGCHRYRKLWMK